MRIERNGEPEARAATAVRAPVADGVLADTAQRYVITLLSSTRPLDDVAARLPIAGFGGASCRRRLVEGRAHYRLEIGPYPTLSAATRALSAARRVFPRAVVRSDRGGSAAPREPHPAAGSALVVQSVLAADPPALSRDFPPVLGGVMEIPDAGSPSRVYAVELMWSPNPLDLKRVPPLTLFDERTLYAVSVHRANHAWYGLRLGFYRDGQEAREAAAELTSYFEGAIAVPATEHEFANARSVEVRPWAARVDPSVVVAA